MRVDESLPVTHIATGTFQVLDEQNKGLMSVPTKIDDSVGKALRTANKGHVTAISHALSFSSRLYS
jgi:hypothetical protein